MTTETETEQVETEKKPSLYDAFWELSSAEKEIIHLAEQLAEQREKRLAAEAIALDLMEEGVPYLYTRSYVAYVMIKKDGAITATPAKEVKY